MDLAPLIYGVKEREAMRVRKDQGEPFPWTDVEAVESLAA